MLKIKIISVLLIVVSIAVGVQSSCTHKTTYEVCFNTEVLPIFKSNCATSGCHDAITHEKDIVLDSYENIMKEVEANKPNSSDAYKVLIGGGEEAMPPNKPLSSQSIALIKAWIENGAKNDPTCQ